MTRFGRYLILTELGRGGMADVYLALAPSLDGSKKLVVLKAIQRSLVNDRSIVDMFLAEARIGAYLRHPNIAHTDGLAAEAGRYFIVMEYLEGRSIAEIARTAPDGRIPIDLGVRMLADALAGLHYAHELTDSAGRRLHIVHRDFSPENVFVTHQGHVKVLDFGIAKTADPKMDVQTAVGEFKGKLRYSAPERFTDEGVDRRADIFSAGVMLWQLLSGRQLWPGHSDLTILCKFAQRARIPNPRALNPDVPERLDEICMRALAYSRADRYQTAAELRGALEAFLASEPEHRGQGLEMFMTKLFADSSAQFRRAIDASIRLAANMAIDAAYRPLSSSPFASSEDESTVRG